MVLLLSKPVHSKAERAKTAKKPVEQKDDAEQQTEENVPFEKMEARPRKAGWEKQKDLSGKLPVKFMDGSVRENKLLAEKEETPVEVEQEEEEAEEEEQEDEEEEGDDDDDDVASDISDLEFEEITNDAAGTASDAAAQPQLSEVDLKLRREHRLAAKKVELAQLCESILEKPEDAFKKNKEHPQNLSRIQQLQSLCRDPDMTVKKLSMLSQLAVFLDILPDYRIRLQSDEKTNGRPLKKAVKTMQDYEAALLNHYQKFLKHCASVVTEGLKGKHPNRELTARDHRDISMAETGVRCLAELLKVKYSFNFHLNLIVALVPMADAHFLSVRKIACEAFEVVYKSDKSCVASSDIVKQISSYVRQKEHRVKQEIIRTFLAMPLEVTMEQGEEARKRAKSDRKKRRRQQNDGDSIGSGLKEAEAVVDKSEREKTQGDILHELVLIYFRILKQATYSTAMPAVLEGLAKFAFLINLDIMIDLLKVLKAVLKQDVLPLSSALQAVLTGLKTLQGPGQELMVDEKEFVDILYRLLRKFSEGEDITCFSTALSCIEAVFLRRKEIVVDRVAAFIKRLLLISVHLQPHQMLACMALIRSLFHRYSKLQQLLESDMDRVASGEYRADVDDPDFSNPYSSACWELTLLHRHFNPKVASFSLGTAEMGPSLPNEYPKAMLDNYNSELTGAFNPIVAVPPQNPLHNKMATDRKRKQTQRRQRERKFFVADPVAEGRGASPFLQRCLTLDETKPTTKPAFRA